MNTRVPDSVTQQLSEKSADGASSLPATVRWKADRVVGLLDGSDIFARLPSKHTDTRDGARGRREGRKEEGIEGGRAPCSHLGDA